MPKNSRPSGVIVSRPRWRSSSVNPNVSSSWPISRLMADWLMSITSAAWVVVPVAINARMASSWRIFIGNLR